MYAHIGRLAIPHIYNVRFTCTLREEKRNVSISGPSAEKRTFEKRFHENRDRTPTLNRS